MPVLASELGVATLWVKDESFRFGLPAFKMLGASWAVYRTLVAELGREFEPWTTLDEMNDRIAPLRPLELVAATDGNHGRAVARMARLLRLDSHILVPRGTVTARIASLEGEGARVTVVDGTYDDTVRASAAQAAPGRIVISDTSWDGYQDVPGHVIEGYATIFEEVDAEISRRAVPGPDVIVVQMGVGALAAAVVRHYAHPGPSRPVLVGVEPTRADCILESFLAGRIVTIAGGQDSIMAGLNCGTPADVAWPDISQGLDAYVTVDDEQARDAMRALAGAGIVSGESGAAGYAGVAELLKGRESDAHRAALGVGAGARVLVISTEGATDPVGYRDAVGRDPNDVKASRVAR